MALTNDTVIAKVIAAQLVVAYREARIFSQRVNNTWRNALNAGGNEVIINRPVAGSVADYTTSTTITYNQVADVNKDALTLQLGGTGGIGKGGAVKYWHVKFDDLNRAVTGRDLLSTAVVEYGQALANQVDDDVRSVMLATGGATSIGSELTIDLDAIAGTDNGFDHFGLEQIHKAMDWKRVPRQGRWLIIGPALAEALQKTVLSNSVLMSTPQQGSLANGRIGSLGGFTLYMADPKHSKFTAKSGAKDPFYSETLIAGSDSATAFIDRIRKQERMRLESSFADVVRGLYEYNAKVLFPERLYKRSYKIEGAGVTNLGLPAAIPAS